ncbi:MAG: hypothetical protein QM811_14350 [Pirellulales bacterium]
MPSLPWRPPTERQQRNQVFLVAAMLVLAVLNLLPGIVGLREGFGPLWSRVAMLIGLWLLGLSAWTATVPDWISLRVAMWSLAGLAAFFCGMTVLVAITPGDRQLPWDLYDVRKHDWVVRWNGVLSFAARLYIGSAFHAVATRDSHRSGNSRPTLNARSGLFDF